jgi:hypothetical protein
VALFDDMVVGQCAAVIHRHPDKVSELYIDEVGVAPAFQRQDIADRNVAGWRRQSNSRKSGNRFSREKRIALSLGNCVKTKR